MQTILSKLLSWVWKNLISLIALFFAIFSFLKATSVQHSTHFADYNRLAWEEYNSFQDQYKKLPTEIPLGAIYVLDSLSDTSNFIYQVGSLNVQWEASVIGLINETASKIHAYQLVVGQKEKLGAIKPFDQEIHSLKPPSATAKEWTYQRMQGVDNKRYKRLSTGEQILLPPSGTTTIAVYLLEPLESPIDERWQFYNPIMALPRCVWRPDRPPPLVSKLDSLTTQSNANVLNAWYSSMQK